MVLEAKVSLIKGWRSDVYNYWVTLQVSNCHQVLRLLLICLPPLRFVALLASIHRSKNNTCDQRSWSCWMSLSKLRLGMGCKKWRTAEHHYYYPGIIALSINGRWLWSKRTAAVPAWQKIRPAKNKYGAGPPPPDCYKFSRSSFGKTAYDNCWTDMDYCFVAWKSQSLKINQKISFDSMASEASSQCLKSLKMSHLNFWILVFSTNFWPIKTDLSVNSVGPQALGFQKLAKLDYFWHF